MNVYRLMNRFALLLGLAAILSLGAACQRYETKTPTIVSGAGETTLVFPDEVSELGGEHYYNLGQLLEDVPVKATSAILTSHDDRYVNRERQQRVAAQLKQAGIQDIEFSTDLAVPHRTIRVSLAHAKAYAPACPDWRGPQYMNFRNQKLSNFGCATSTNLARMAANPEDLLGNDTSPEAYIEPDRSSRVIQNYRSFESETESVTVSE